MIKTFEEFLEEAATGRSHYVIKHKLTGQTYGHFKDKEEAEAEHSGLKNKHEFEVVYKSKYHNKPKAGAWTKE